MKQSDRMPDLERWNMPHRSVDMRDWEVAVNMAKNVHRTDRSRLMDLYDSLVKDAHLGSVLETRVLRVQRSKFKLVGPDGKAKPELLTFLEAQWFEDFLRYVVEAEFVGHTLIELGELPKPGDLRTVNRIDPRNVLPFHGVVARRMGEETGYKFREEPLRSYLIEVGRPDDLGLLERVAPVAIVKKYAVGSWSAFVGTYGIPSRWVKTAARDARRVRQLEEVMQNMLSSAYAVIQGDEEFGISPTPGGDPHKVFDDLISRMNSEISKRVLGQDGTTDNKDASGTYGSMKVLQGVAEDRHQADKTAALYVINQELLPRLVALGYPLKGIRFQWDELRDMSAMETVEAVAKLGVVFDIDPKHVEERTGIKILGARRMPGEIGPGGDPADPVVSPDGLSIQDTAMNGAQVASLLDLMTKVSTGEIPAAVARPLIRVAFPKVPEERIDQMLEGMKQADPPPTDTPPKGNGKQSGKKKGEAEEGGEEDEDEDGDGITAQWPRKSLGSCGVCGGSRDMDITAEGGLVPLTEEEADAVLREIEDSGGLFSQHYFNHTAEALKSAFDRGWPNAPVNPEAIDTVAHTVMEANIYQFSGLKTEYMAREMNEIARSSKGFADFKRRVVESKKFGKFEAYRATEYANAVNSGMQASRYYSMKERADALPFWRYETMEDGRVREAHARLNNKVFHHNDSIWREIYPPNGWRCRCYVTPIDDGTEALPKDKHSAQEFIDPKEYAVMKSSGFAVNRSQLGEVFKLNASYNTGKLDQAMGIKENYGRLWRKQRYADIMSRELPGMPQGALSREEAEALLFPTPQQSKTTFHDHVGRPWSFSRDAYRKHTDPGHKGFEQRYEQEKRYGLAHAIPDVLKQPDEVWLLGSSKRDTPGAAHYKYIRYYEGKTIVVEARAILQARSEPSMRVVTWYEADAKTIGRHRMGNLVKKNAR
ncbi:MAG: DUF935 family protein [Flavobacteriales bacterium]|nr:DUF935 family protein [Flavobacteriales bacterium]